MLRLQVYVFSRSILLFFWFIVSFTFYKFSSLNSQISEVRWQNDAEEFHQRKVSSMALDDVGQTSSPSRVQQQSPNNFLTSSSSSHTRSIRPGIRMTEAKMIDEMDVYNFENSSVRSTNETIIINPHPFHFLLNPKNVCDDKNIFLLVYVHTRPESFARREVIRNTWARSSNYKDLVVRCVFVMGKPQSQRVQKAVILESDIYGDIVQEDFVDSYRNLTYKAVAGLKWVTHYCSHPKFILKTDDDIFVNMFQLLRLLRNKREYAKDALLCNARFNDPVARQGKWAVSYKERKHPVWPPYCQGLAYIMSPDVAIAFYRASFDVPFLWLDDVYVTGFLSRRLGINVKPINYLFIGCRELESRLGGKNWHRVVFSHIHSINSINRIWQKLLTQLNVTNHSRQLIAF